MRRLIVARLVLTAIGILVWGYGQRTERADLQNAGIAILAVVLLLRFVPKRWLGDE